MKPYVWGTTKKKNTYFLLVFFAFALFFRAWSARTVNNKIRIVINFTLNFLRMALVWTPKGDMMEGKAWQHLNLRYMDIAIGEHALIAMTWTKVGGKKIFV